MSCPKRMPVTVTRFVGSCFLLAIAVAGCHKQAKDATGHWTGAIHVLPAGGGQRVDAVVVIFEQQGDVVTGTLGPSEMNQLPFKKGRTTGKNLRIEMEGNPIVFVLTLDGDRLSGEIQDANDPSKILAKVELKRKQM